MIFVVVVVVKSGFFVFFGKNREKSDLSGTDCVSDFERERTRRMKNSFADELADDVGETFVFVVGITNEATGAAALAC